MSFILFAVSFSTMHEEAQAGSGGRTISNQSDSWWFDSVVPLL